MVLLLATLVAMMLTVKQLECVGFELLAAVAVKGNSPLGHNAV
jgi:hypothetical protein